MVPIRNRRLLTAAATRALLVWLVVVLVAAACASSAEIGETPSASTEPAETVAVTPVPTVEPTAEPQDPTPAPTATPVPAQTPTPTAAPSPTAAPTVAPSPTPTPDPVIGALAASSLTSVRCPPPIAHSQVSCFDATIPLDHQRPDGPTVDVFVARVDNGNPRNIGPVLFLQGGPGAGGAANADRFVGVGHDVIAVDQRGTGRSEPKLECGEVEALWVAERTAVAEDRVDEETVFAAYEACANRLSDETDLDHFNTLAVARDMEIIRQLFELEQWSIWGISYGTRVGLTMLREHPGSIRAAALDSVVPLDIDFFATIPAHGLRSFELLDSACDASTCVEQHGDVLSELQRLARALDADPVSVPVTRPVSGESFEYLVDGGELLDLVFAQLYSTTRLRALPRQVTRAESGGIEELVTGYVARRDPERFDLAIGVYYSTWCREEWPFHDPTADDALIAQAPDVWGAAFEDALSADSIGRLCGYFDVEPASAVADTAVSSDVPTIVFAGAFDPITPPDWSRLVADRLDNAIYVEMTNHGHGMTTRCPLQLRIDFFADPTAELDLSCVSEAGPPIFE